MRVQWTSAVSIGAQEGSVGLNGARGRSLG